jgi:peroxiredoxin
MISTTAIAHLAGIAARLSVVAVGMTFTAISFGGTFEFQGKALADWAKGEGIGKAGFVEAVEHWGLDAIPEWVKLLTPSHTPGERIAALSAIEIVLRDNGLRRFQKVAAETAVPALIPLLKDEKGYIRARTMNTLRAVGPAAREAVPLLLAVLRDPNDPDAVRFSTRNCAALALGEIHEPPEPIVAALGAAMNDEDARLRRSAVRALSAMSWRAASALPAIEAAMKGADAEFLKSAESALVEIRRPARPGIGDPLPVLEFARLDGGGRRNLSEFQGKVVVLDFWSVTCPPCQPAMAHLNEVARKRKEWSSDVAFVGISEDETAETSREHATKRGWTSVELLFDAGQRARQLFRASLPEVIVADRSGKIAWRGHPSEIALEDEIQKQLREER